MRAKLSAAPEPPRWVAARIAFLLSACDGYVFRLGRAPFDLAREALREEPRVTRAGHPGPVEAALYEAAGERSFRRPVAGAEVEVCYRVSLVGTHGSSVDVDLRRTTTDADGRFHVPPHPVRAFLEIGGVPRYPDVRATHPLYGSGETSFHYPDDRFAGWDRIEVQLWRDDGELDALLAGLPHHDSCDPSWEPWKCHPEQEPSKRWGIPAASH